MSAVAADAGSAGSWTPAPRSGTTRASESTTVTEPFTDAAEEQARGE